MAFIAELTPYKLPTGFREGKYVIRICIVGIWTIPEPKECGLIWHKAMVIFASAAIGEWPYGGHFSVRQRGWPNIDFLICDKQHKWLSVVYLIV
ncbi:hypothetical protein EDF82_1403 [Raoultella sp. BIGb0399]|uniref:hypothetical protein n=1 Tax=Raoultella sp. BIGb0399 TaxID=2485119 RepID=UPI000F4C2C26|nr:hypothetical protein [Raoultella sp. BIGb0399]ROS16274.1 hypothetical protein EDF82_1403 [Raoultella sp. BIGb0399]